MLKALAIGLALLAQTSSGVTSPDATSADVSDSLPVYEVPTVVVTATRLSLPADASVWPVEVIEVEEDGFYDLAHALGQSNGVDYRQQGGVGSLALPFLGGISANRVLVLDNGIPVNTRRDGLIDYSLLAVAPGDRIEVVKGPLSALYGSSALGGVINIIPSYAPGITANLTGTHNLGINTGVRVAADWGRAGSRISGSFLQDPGARNNEQVSRYNAKAGLWAAPADILFMDAELGFTHRALGVPGPVPDLKWGTPLFGDSTVTSTYDNQKDNLVKGRFKLALTPAEAFTASLSLYGIKQDFDYSYRFSFTPASNYLSSYDDTRLGADLQLGASLSDAFILTGGGSIISEKLDAVDVTTDSATGDTLFEPTRWDASDLQMGVWAEAVACTGIFTPTLAVRLDYSQEYGMAVSPEGGVNVELLPRILYVSAAYGQSFRAPTLNDLYHPWGGDTTLLAERGQTAALSATIKPFYMLEANLAATWKDIKDMIVWVPDEYAMWKPTNVDQVTILGGEISLKFRTATDLITGSFGAAYNYATETRQVPVTVTYDTLLYPIAYQLEEVSREAAFIAPFILKGDVKVSPWSGGEIAARAAWTDSRLNYYPQESMPDLNGTAQITSEEKMLDPSLKIDLSLSQRLFSLIKLEAGVLNLLDDRTPTNFGNSLGDGDYPTAPRRFYAGLSVSYQ